MMKNKKNEKKKWRFGECGSVSMSYVQVWVNMEKQENIGQVERHLERVGQGEG